MYNKIFLKECKRYMEQSRKVLHTYTGIQEGKERKIMDYLKGCKKTSSQ